jgi:hypothetical protein
MALATVDSGRHAEKATRKGLAEVGKNVTKLLALSASERKVIKFNLAPARLLGDSSLSSSDED